jgi:hypothetical protein
LREKSRKKSREQSVPLVVTGKRNNVEVLTAVDDAAERLGLSPGLTLAQARAMHPDIEVVPEDADADAVLIEFTGASMNWSPISAVAWMTPALPIRSPLPALSAPRGLSHIMANRQVMLAAKNVRYSRHCHCPRCGFRRQQSQVLPVLA